MSSGAKAFSCRGRVHSRSPKKTDWEMVRNNVRCLTWILTASALKAFGALFLVFPKKIKKRQTKGLATFFG